MVNIRGRCTGHYELPSEQQDAEHHSVCSNTMLEGLYSHITADIVASDRWKERIVLSRHHNVRCSTGRLRNQELITADIVV